MKRHYIPSRSSISVDNSINNKSITKKGGSDALRVNYKDIERIISNLRKNHDKRLDLLDEDLRKDIDILTRTVTLQYKTESYPILYAVIQKYFNDIDIKNILPNTIASYCYGCQQVEGFNDIGCSATCVNGIPPPKMPQWAKCDHTVVLLTRKDGHNYSKVLNATNNRIHAYIFVVNLEKNTIENLNSDEKMVLSRLGIKTYHLFEYRAGSYFDISKGIKSLLENLSEKDKLLYKHKEHCDDSNNNYLFGVAGIVILIFLILIFVAHRR